MAVAPAPRVDWAPVVAKLDAIHKRYARTGVLNAPDSWRPTNITELAERIGRARRTLERYANDGGVPIVVADDIATALGVHPFELWGDQWQEVEVLVLDAVDDLHLAEPPETRRRLQRRAEAERGRARRAARTAAA